MNSGGILLLRSPDRSVLVAQLYADSVTAYNVAHDHAEKYFTNRNQYYLIDDSCWWIGLSGIDSSQPPDVDGPWPIALFIEGIEQLEKPLLLFVNRRPQGTFELIQTNSVEECLEKLQTIYDCHDIGHIQHKSGTHSFTRGRHRIAVAVVVGYEWA